MYNSNKPDEISKFTKNLKLNFPSIAGVRQSNNKKSEENKLNKHRRYNSVNVNEHPVDTKLVYRNTIEKNTKLTPSRSPDVPKNKIQDKKNPSNTSENVLSICGKKTPEETIQILETILGKNSVQRMGNKVKEFLIILELFLSDEMYLLLRSGGE